MKAIITLCLCTLGVSGLTTYTEPVVILEQPPRQSIIPSQKRLMKQPKVFQARVTYWSPNEKDYKLGSKIASNPKGKAIESWTVAVDPKKIHYGSTLYIPELAEVLGDGVFCAEDTGSAVKQMKAIPMNKRDEVNVVIDVYVSSNETMNRLAKKMPHYMTVYLYE
jgi:3D (Asp-Asp-Asp) domain-containing protein